MRNLSLLALAGLAACAGDKDTATPSGETGTVGETGTDTQTPAGGFDIQGTALNAATQQPATEGLCVELLDPTPAIKGLAPEILLTTKVGAGGAFTFTDVVTDSVLGLLMSVKDCATPGSTVYTSATGIQPEQYQGLGDGDVLADQRAFSIDNAFLAGLEASATAAGYAGDLGDDGFLMGFVLAADTPVSGATVGCLDTCNPTWYLDTDPLDGLFTNAVTGLNAATDAKAGAMWIIAAAPIGQYTAEDGGAHTFATQLNGSSPGSATFTAFFAE
jgi:hypothetical protein